MTVALKIDANPRKIGTAFMELRNAGLKPRLADKGPYSIVVYVNDEELSDKIRQIKAIDGIYGVYANYS